MADLILEKMDDFFAARAEIYDTHMLNEVEGCAEAYCKMAELLALGTECLLDLGCGTGLELEWIFRRFPELRVTGVDMTQAMLDKLREKYAGKALELINASYFDVDFGNGRFDAAVSFQTMHHFEQNDKLGLYQRVCASLKHGGRYVECDYMVLTQEEEDFWFAENKRIRAEQNVPQNAFYHFDTPCTVENQIQLLLRAGFLRAEQVYRQENTTILVAYR